MRCDPEYSSWPDDCRHGTERLRQEYTAAYYGGIEPPTSGEIWVDGQKLSGLSDYELTLLRRRRIGFIFQSFNLVPTLNVIDNVTLPLILDGISQRDAIPRALESLKRVDMSHRLQHLPSQLSGGEQQRVAIARALVIKPSLVLADEPTGNLDSVRGRDITRLLRDVAHESQQTVVVVTHDIRVASQADRLIVLLDGKVRFDGRPNSDAEWMAAAQAGDRWMIPWKFFWNNLRLRFQAARSSQF